jgi:hypothetical protein
MSNNKRFNPQTRNGGGQVRGDGMMNLPDPIFIDEDKGSGGGYFILLTGAH